MDSVIGDLKAQNGVYVGVEAYKNRVHTLIVDTF
jgi:hypothetical protein